MKKVEERFIQLPTEYSKLTTDEKRRVREAYVYLQDGNCCFCDSPLDESVPKTIKEIYIDRSRYPPGFFRYPVHLHHDHDTDLTLGAVHSRCNAVLFEYYDE